MTDFIRATSGFSLTREVDRIIELAPQALVRWQADQG